MYLQEPSRRAKQEPVPEAVEIEDDEEEDDDEDYVGDVDFIDGTVAEDDMMADEYEDEDELESMSIDSVIEIPDDDDEEGT